MKKHWRLQVRQFMWVNEPFQKKEKRNGGEITRLGCFLLDTVHRPWTLLWHLPILESVSTSIHYFVLSLLFFIPFFLYKGGSQITRSKGCSVDELHARASTGTFYLRVWSRCNLLCGSGTLFVCSHNKKQKYNPKCWNKCTSECRAPHACAHLCKRFSCTAYSSVIAHRPGNNKTTKKTLCFLFFHHYIGGLVLQPGKRDQRWYTRRRKIQRTQVTWRGALTSCAQNMPTMLRPRPCCWRCSGAGVAGTLQRPTFETEIHKDVDCSLCNPHTDGSSSALLCAVVGETTTLAPHFGIVLDCARGLEARCCWVRFVQGWNLARFWSLSWRTSMLVDVIVSRQAEARHVCRRV